MDGETADKIESWRHVQVNGQIYDNDDPVVSGRDVLGLAGLKPSTEFQLIQVRKNRTHLKGADDKIDLKAESGSIFRAFEGDRSFSWTLDEISQVWGAETLEVDELIELFSIDSDHELVLERGDEPDIVLRPGGSVSLAERGTEDIVTRRKKPEFVLVSVFTTAGIYPAEGAVRVKPDELVVAILEKAAKKLDLKDTESWVVTYDNREINPALSFAQNALIGTVELDWSPREGGGGDA